MAKQSKSYTIQWVKLMMISSQLLLIVFTVNWLYTQYQKEKEQLTMDVHSALRDVNREVADSLMFNKLVKPVLHNGQIQQLPDDATLVYRGKSDYNKQSDIKIKVDFDTARQSDSIRKFIKRKGIEMQKDIALNAIPGHAAVIIDVNNTDTNYTISDTGAGVIRQILPLIIKEIQGDSFNVKINSAIQQADSMLVRTRFNNKAEQHKWKFETVWVYNTKDENPKKGLVISNTYLNQNTSIILKDYKMGLIKKISPQILFVCILLLSTGGSFLFAYRSLKKQMQLTAMKNDFISNMSHELKTPISTVKVALEALDSFNGLENPQTTRDYLQIAGLEMNRLDMLVNKALNTTMLEEGRVVLQKEKQDVRQLVTDTLALLRFRFSQMNAKVDVKFAEGDYIMSADKMHLQGVLINILDNSLKYCDKQPEISIHGDAIGNNISIAIADNGPGIKQEYIKRVFDKFFRVPIGDTHNVKGYGLGLSYAKQIVTLHGGTIDVHNRTDKGCVFTINLPKA